jgi:hypothetical protein
MRKGEAMTEEQKRRMTEGRARRRAERAEAAALGVSEPMPYVAPDREPEPVEDLFDAETQALIDEGLITAADVLNLRIEAKAKIEVERRANAKKNILARLIQQERDAAGVTPAKDARRRYLDEIVDITITLPMLRSPNAAVINWPDPIRIDGKMFAHGRTYQVSRAQAATLLDMMGKARKHHAQVNGESPAYYDQNRGAFSFMGGVARGTGGTGLQSPIMERRGATA